MIHNKKGVMPLVVLAIVVAVVIGLITLTPFASAGKTITSNTPKSKDCSAENIPVSIKGTAFTRDTAFFGVTAEPVRIDVDQVTAGGKTLGITRSDFVWQVQLIDSFTGNVVAEDSGDNSHPGGGKLIEDAYRLNFFIPDNNCDGQIDDFQGTLTYEVRNDNGEVFKIEKDIEFSGGRYIRE